MYSQPPLMDRHNRGELREEGEKTEERKEEREKDFGLITATKAKSR